MANQTYKFNNFDLNLFSNLLNESLQVTNQLMLEFKDNMIKSASFSSTKSLIKLWVIPLNKMIYTKSDNAISENQGILDLDVESKAPDFSKFNFNFYILKGDLFSKYISVFSKDEGVSLEFLVNDEGQAVSITIIGKTATGGYRIKTTFPLTKEELIINKIDDYSEIIDQCTPTDSMSQFVLNQQQVTEIKTLIRNLHKSSTDNTSFLSFSINKDKIKINDKVFEVEFPNSNCINFESELTIDFNMLKSDFLIIGNHNFNIITETDSDKVILGGQYKNSVIWCLTTKHNNSAVILSGDSSEQEYMEAIDALNINEYIDDLPF